MASPLFVDRTGHSEKRRPSAKFGIRVAGCGVLISFILVGFGCDREAESAAEPPRTTPLASSHAGNAREQDAYCACQRQQFPTPPVHTKATKDGSDAPTPMADSTTPMGVIRNLDLDTSLTLPPTSAPLISKLKDLPKTCIPLSQVYELFPGLKNTSVWTGGDSLSLGREFEYNTPCLGATIIQATLADIRAVERDYVTYLAKFASEFTAVYPVAGSYRSGFDAQGCPFTEIDVYYHSTSRWLPKPFVQPLREHCVDGRIVVDYYVIGTSDYYYFAGRDTYYSICGEGTDALYGWLVVTEFGFDIKSCPDSGQICGEILKNLGYMRDTAHAIRKARDLRSSSGP